MIVIFKSESKMYEKEKSGIKPNTLRKMVTEDDRFIALRRKLNTWDYQPSHICIENKETKEHFIREITDVTEWDGYLIISWRHEDD